MMAAAPGYNDLADIVALEAYVQDLVNEKIRSESSARRRQGTYNVPTGTAGTSAYQVDFDEPYPTGQVPVVIAKPQSTSPLVHQATASARPDGTGFTLYVSRTNGGAFMVRYVAVLP